MNENIHGERTASELQDRVTELIEQQTAISEVLRAIAGSPHDLQPVFDAILDSATRLCQADAGSLRLSEEGGHRLVAVRGDALLVGQVWSSFPVIAEKGSLPSRIATSRLPTHIPDVATLEGNHRDDFWIAVVNAGLRTGLVVPLLKDNEIVGYISLGRKQMQPFTDKQISLFRDFAAQATFALESTRRERQYREAQMALAHANRGATMGQLTASITHEVNQPITAAVTYALAARRFLSADPPNFREDGVPFAMAILLVAAAFLWLGVSFWPYMVPYSVTVEQAAAPAQSLEFLFWGAGIVVFPVAVIYIGIVYWIFSGKVAQGYAPRTNRWAVYKGTTLR
jgi:GAF domain-containing protein